MKKIDIKAGHFYWDLKEGLRKVLAVKEDGTVSYELLAAKQEQEWRNGGYESLLGKIYGMSLDGFSAWAKMGFEAAEGQEKFLELQARKLKLAPGERELLDSQMADRIAGSPVFLKSSYQNRSMSSLVKKGLVIQGQIDLEYTALGAAYARHMLPPLQTRSMKP